MNASSKNVKSLIMVSQGAKMMLSREKVRKPSPRIGDQVVSPGGTVRYTSGKDDMRYFGHLNSPRLGRRRGRIFYSVGNVL